MGLATVIIKEGQIPPLVLFGSILDNYILFWTNGRYFWSLWLNSSLRQLYPFWRLFKIPL